VSGDLLIDGLPDLVVLVRRDGIILGHGGGQGLTGLKPDGQAAGKRLETVWPEHVAKLIGALVRKAIALRAPAEARFQHRECGYEARASAKGPDRALCVIRTVLAGRPEDALETTGERSQLLLDRRGFLQRFKESVSLAALCEKPAAVAVIHVDGVADIAQSLDGKLPEQLMSAAILRFSSQSDGPAGEKTWRYLGQLSDGLLAVVLETSDREAIASCVARLCASLREPIGVGDAAFHLTPYAGAAILGHDATAAKILLDHARAAATEARRSLSPEVCFFTDTLRLRSLARLDVARELRGAIAHGDVRLRYIGRHDLATGQLLTWVGYLRWLHPLRGEIRPVEFLRVAETIGLAAALSRAVLDCLREDFAACASQWNANVRLSFGALRHHILHDGFAADITRFLAASGVPATRLELRIAEKTFIACDPAVFKDLQQLGIRLVVDEVGRGMGSLDGLARTPIWGLQLDRAWTTALRKDEVALKVCRAGISVANALGLTPIATGVDDEEQRQSLLALGCRHGSGDLYRDAVPEAMKPLRAVMVD
jgi:EAL domain-containing protein (putative c-di-GMP-specific phosphodiesterase class I)/GGDEF domain-containing protein